MNQISSLNKKITPFISVIIASRNPKYLDEAINSVLTQEFCRDMYELIIVSSNENTNSTSKINFEGVRYYYKRNSTMGEALAYGISVSVGEVLCFLDDDDRFSKNKLSVIYELFLNNPELNYIHNSSKFIDYKGRTIAGKGLIHKTNKYYKISPKRKLCSELLFNRLRREKLDFNSSSISLRKKLMEPYIEYLGRVTALVDTIMLYLILEKEGMIGIITQEMTDYRLHDSLSNSSIISKESVENHILYYKKCKESLLPLTYSSEVSSCLIKRVNRKIISINIAEYLLSSNCEINIQQIFIFLKMNLLFRPIYSLLLCLLVFLKMLIGHDHFYPFSVKLMRIGF